MSLCQLSVEHLRNLQSVQLEPAPGLNVIFGENGAGKTSLLEAIFFLGRARSFRGGRPEHLIARDTESFVVRALVQTGAERLRVGVQRSSSDMRVRVGGEEVRSLSALARHLPVQVINNESQRLLQDGPQARRSFLSWGVFHVEHEYHGHWRRYERALRQRNAALKGGNQRLARSWEPELVATAEAVTQQREQYVARLVAAAQPLLQLWLPQEELSFAYRRGWGGERSLAAAYDEGREREVELGHTLYGPHRADLGIRSSGIEAQHRLSRGQQKLLSIAMLIAQTQMGVHAGGNWILLIDDLPAELDLSHRTQVLESLQGGSAQCFITCTEREAIPLSPGVAKWFHVEHGAYREVI